MSNNKQIEKPLELPHQETIVGTNTIQTKPFDNQKTMSNNKQQTAIGIVNHKIDNLEWAFQFNNDVPVMIAEYINGKREMNLTIGDTSTSNIVFSDGNGNTFKIFAREKGGNK